MITEATETMSREAFNLLSTTHRVIPVTRALFSDSDSPVSIYRKLAKSRPGTFLLESAEQGGVWTRFSFVGCGSFGVLTEQDGHATWIDYGLSAERLLAGSLTSMKPLDAVEAVYSAWQSPAPHGLPPLAGGLVGFVGWETVRQLEHLPNVPTADVAVPTQALSFVSELVVIDHKAGALVFIANVLNDGTHDTDFLWADAQRRLDAMVLALENPAGVPLSEVDHAATTEIVAQTDRDVFLSNVAKAKQFIVDGDVFQVVLSQRFDTSCSAESVDVYRMLRHLNPSPYLYHLSLETKVGRPYAIVGSSPEALVTVQDHRVMTHPIAGSRPRGATIDEDQAFESDLLDDQKERAEHLMLVDLSRNDLLKVCVPSSVEVSEFMRIERFSHIMHIVSTVEGDLSPGKSPVDVFRATFPAGTLSGAPKPRALEIIDELEDSQRGVYGGVVGYFGFGGDADLAIAIRTATIAEGRAYVQAGAGIVADSVPESEFEECRNKAAAPLRAVALANGLRAFGSA